MVTVLSSASISDWRTREVSDAHWIVLSVVGVAAFTAYSILENGFKWEYVALTAGSCLIVFDLFANTNRFLIIIYPAMAVLFAVPIYLLYIQGDPFTAAWTAIPTSYTIFLLMYIFGAIPGGADIKCLMSLAFLFPVYPTMFALPLIGMIGNPLAEIFTFAVSALFLGAILTMMVALPWIANNLIRGEQGRELILGRTMELAEARTSHVWPMHDLEDGRLVRVHYIDDPALIYDRLEAAGHERIWVTPMVPFVVPLSMAAVILAVIGNPLFLFI